LNFALLTMQPLIISLQVVRAHVIYCVVCYTTYLGFNNFLCTRISCLFLHKSSRVWNLIVLLIDLLTACCISLFTLRQVRPIKSTIVSVVATKRRGCGEGCVYEHMFLWGRRPGYSLGWDIIKGIHPERNFASLTPNGNGTIV